MTSHPNGEVLQAQYEIRPDPHEITSTSKDEAPDYEPHPSEAISVAPGYQAIVDSITRLYSGICADREQGEKDMQVYAADAVYDDTWSYCDTRYKIAGQWYGIPGAMAKSQTLATQIISCKSIELGSGDQGTQLAFKLRQEYTPRIVHFTKAVDSLVTLTLDKDDKVRYHKDMWNENDYRHAGLGKVMKTLNGDQLTKITRPPSGL
ncbi:MAG: hypothetical protein M1828_006671 [Chrysothrix sp. TS-e1954]|nr:MAG: hypothetical protein M1828_006671 [Chrysothrix sp. TS-e1954]